MYAEGRGTVATSKVWVALSALAGAGAALVTVATLGKAEDGNRQTPKTRADEESGSKQTNKSIAVQAAPALGRLEALEREMARWRDERNRDHEPTPQELQNPEEERRRVEVGFAELERHLLTEPVDPSWSGGATESLRNDLGAIAERDGFSLLAAECRTEMCRATLRWDNYEAAVKTGMRLPERAIPGLNCAKTIWLKVPDNPAAPYSTSLFLDCSEQRAGNADVIK